MCGFMRRGLLLGMAWVIVIGAGQRTALAGESSPASNIPRANQPSSQQGESSRSRRAASRAAATAPSEVPIPPDFVIITFVGPDGRAVPGVGVGPMGYGYSTKQPRWTFGFPPYRRTVSDERGRAAFYLPEAGASTSLRLYALQEARRLTGIWQLSTDVLGTSIVLNLQPACRVTGRVTCSVWQARGVLGCEVGVSIARNGRDVVYHYAEDGAFECFLPPGRYTLEANGQYLLARKQEVNIEPGRRELDLGTIDLEPDAFGKMLGGPAPELTHVNNWRRGKPVRLSGLRGRYVLVYFCNWPESDPLELSRVLEICDAFDEKDLKVVIVHHSLRSAERLEKLLATMEWRVGRPLPCPVGLDEDGREFVSPDEDKRYLGATARAYGLQHRSPEDAALLIGPSGKILESPWPLNDCQQLIGQLEQLTGFPRRSPAWEQRLYAVYGLGPGEVVKRVPQPFIPERKVFRTQSRAKIDASFYGSTTWDKTVWYMMCEWDGSLHWGGGGCSSYPLSDLLAVSRTDVEGPKELLYLSLPGDWVIRRGIGLKERHHALEKCLHEDFGLDVEIRCKPVKRDVIVARGTYRLRPLQGVRYPGFVNISTQGETEMSYPDVREGTLGDFLLSNRCVGLGLNRDALPVVDETQSSNAKLQWLYCRNWATQGFREDPVKLQDYLDPIARQTSLTFTREQRERKIWFVSRKR
jgi:hypothetical protein